MASVYLTDRDEHVLAGKDSTDRTAASFERRIAAAWAKGHELAADRDGDGYACERFTGEPGLSLLNALRALGTKAPIEAMVDAVQLHLGIDPVAAEHDAAQAQAEAEAEPSPE